MPTENIELDVVETFHEEAKSGNRLFIVGKQTAGLSITTSYRDALCCIVLGPVAAQRWKGQLKRDDYLIAKGIRSGAHPFQFGIQIIPSFNAVEIERGFQSAGNEPADVRPVELPAVNWSPPPPVRDREAARKRIIERNRELGISRPLEKVV